MMGGAWQSAMKDAISEVLETMFFVMVDFEEDAELDRPYECGSRIQLRNGERRVEISFMATYSFARTITANLLAMDEEEVEAEDLDDMMKELANMIGGNFQARIEESGWLLGIPAIESTGERPLQGEAMEFSCFGEPSGAVALQFHASGGAVQEMMG